MKYHNIIILNGPNLNLLGRRETEIYGAETFDSYFDKLKSKWSKHNLAYEQTNHEGVLIDLIQEYGFNTWGIILNAAGYTHTSVAIADAVKAVPCHVVEVHISDIYQREAFRHHSYLKAVTDHQIVGKGLAGYDEAVAWLAGEKK